MFENLSSREKKLMLAVGALVPTTLLFLCIFYLINSFKANNERLLSLDLQIIDQKELENEGVHAARRQAYYSHASLPPSSNIARTDYENWLKTALAESRVTWNSITPKDGIRLSSADQAIGVSSLFEVSARGTLTQFNDFLSKFYQLDVLHRINKMTIIPQDQPGTQKKTRDGELAIKMTVESLSLTSGKHQDGFENFRTNLVNKEKDYQAILRRNIFGPANSEPIISISNKNKTWTAGKRYSTSFTANDANKNDLLTFELIESSIGRVYGDGQGTQIETKSRNKKENSTRSRLHPPR